MSAHKCHIPNCKREVQRRLLMCPEHWAQVPIHLQIPVKDHFHPKQCKGGKPSIEWLRAARYAINHIMGTGVQWPAKLPY